ncbi:unnamed protein product, partial [Brassica oleracea]
LLPIVPQNKKAYTPEQVYREVWKSASVPTHSVLARDSVTNTSAVAEV